MSVSSTTAPCGEEKTNKKKQQFSSFLPCRHCLALAAPVGNPRGQRQPGSSPPLATAVLNKSGWLPRPQMSLQGQGAAKRHVKPVPAEAKTLSLLPQGAIAATGVALVQSQRSTSHGFSSMDTGAGGRWFNVSLVPVSHSEG